MKLVKVPPDYTPENMKYLCERLSKQTGEKIILIPNDIELIDLSTQDLYRLKEEIEDAIHDKEVISNM